MEKINVKNLLNNIDRFSNINSNNNKYSNNNNNNYEKMHIIPIHEYFIKKIDFSDYNNKNQGYYQTNSRNYCGSLLSL